MDSETAHSYRKQLNIDHDVKYVNNAVQNIHEIRNKKLKNH